MLCNYVVALAKLLLAILLAHMHSKLFKITSVKVDHVLLLGVTLIHI
jgi:hypothetical protein